MNRPVTIALAGIGGYGEFYLNELLPVRAGKNAKFVGAIDPQPDRCPRLAELKQSGVPVYPDMDAFYAASSADLMIISAPIHHHLPLTATALSHGSNVLCEKPVAATVQEAEEMAALAKKAGKFAAVGYQWCYSAAVQALKHDVMSGALGKPLGMKTMVLSPRYKKYYGRSPWAGALKSGNGKWVLDSPVNNAVAHYLQNMLYVLGGTLESSAEIADVQAELYRANPIQNYDTAALRCHTRSGVELLFYTSHATFTGVGPLFRYDFEKAVVYYKSDGIPLIRARFKDGQLKEYGDPNADSQNKIWDCVEVIEGKRKTLACDARTATPHILCVNGAQESVPEVCVLPKELVKVQELPDKDTLTWVDGLIQSWTQCFDMGIMPSEHGGIEWASAGKVVDLRNYHFFPGGKK